MLRSIAFLSVLLLALGTLRLVAPGATPFLDDEARLISLALDHNASGKISRVGLRGTKGATYGPLAIWLYRGLLLITEDLVRLTLLKSLVMTLITIFSLLWLIRTCDFLPRALTALPLLSPYHFYYARKPWDNDLCIPLSALTVAAYLAFCKHRKGWFLLITTTGCALLMNTHLMAGPLVLGICVHLLWLHRQWLTRNSGWALTSIVVPVTLSLPYLAAFQINRRTKPAAFAESLSLFFQQGRQLTAGHIDYLYGNNWWDPLLGEGWLLEALIRSVQGWTCLAYPLVWVGAAVAFNSYLRARRQGQALGMEQQMGLLCLLSVLAFGALSLSGRLHNYPHYLNGIWIIPLLLLGVGVRSILSKSNACRFLSSQGICLGLVLVLITLTLQLKEEPFSAGFGPSLTSKIELIQALDRYDKGTPVEWKTANHKKDQTWKALMTQLYANQPGPKISGYQLAVVPVGRAGWGLQATPLGGDLRMGLPANVE